VKIRISPLDRLFSKMIRRRDGFRCQRCGAQHAENSMGLHAAHIFGRGRYSTRFHPDNVWSLCYGCHAFIDSHPHDKIAWGMKKLGTKKYNALRRLSDQPARFGQVERRRLREALRRCGLAAHEG